MTEKKITRDWKANETWDKTLKALGDTNTDFQKTVLNIKIETLTVGLKVREPNLYSRTKK